MSDRKMELRHDRYTVSLLSDHMVFAPKYRGKIFNGRYGDDYGRPYLQNLLIT